MSTPRGEQPAGLRERKKARTRAAIQDHALRLFIEQGYDATTVEQIAAAADVSQSTFFRYFPAKEDTLRYDRLDPILLEAFVRQPRELTPLQAVRNAMREVLGSLRAEESELERARQRLLLSVPELRAKLFEQLGEAVVQLNAAVAERVGRTPDDFAVQTWSGAVVGIALSTFFSSRRDPDDFMAALDRGLALLDAGLPL
jgi:AcrR family transcriptional regulator